MNVEESSARGRLVWVAGLLAALTFVLYLGVASFEFLNYDDPDYVTGNAVVSRGFSASGVLWAFGFRAANWHPLTWLAHMLDVQCFGLKAGAHHLVSAGLHALNAALLFAAWVGLTKRFWTSLLVAALFAVHPLRVESVAWIAEKKELLASAFFFGLLIAYGRYARSKSRSAYAVVLLCLVLGCMAKPMLVTVPFVLLLLDVWPLQRLARPAVTPANGARSVRTVWLEKLPLFAIAALSGVLTLLAQRAGGAVGSLDSLPLLDRIWTAGAGYLAYLRATLWPAGLAAFYPHPLLVGKSVLVPGLAGACLVLVLSVLAWRSLRRCPAFFTGWFWFLGMLVPVIGLVQVGDQAWADRYAYLPVIGLTVALVFGLAEAMRERSALLSSLGFAGVAAAGVLAFVTARELPHWKDSRSLFTRALEVTGENWVARNNLGLVYLERHEIDRAKEHFQEAVRIRPSFVQARYNLGRAQEAAGEREQALKTYREVLDVSPGHSETLVRLATLARADGNPEQATACFEQALEKNPGNALVWVTFARFLLEQGDLDRAANCAMSALKLESSLADAQLVLAEIALRRGEMDEAGERLGRAAALNETSEVHALLGRWRAMKQDRPGARREFERALVLEPNSASAHYDLGTLLLGTGERDAARAQFQQVIDLHPGDPEALTALAVMALEEKKHGEAVELLKTVLQRAPDFPLALTNLAVAYEQEGEWRKAVECYEKANASASPDPDTACSLAWILATGPDETLLNGERAVMLATYAMQNQTPNAREVLAAAHARAGDFEKAVQYQQQAIARARTSEQKRPLEERLHLYEAEQPFTRPR